MRRRRRRPVPPRPDSGLVRAGSAMSTKRSKSNQYENTSLVQIEGVNNKEDVAWYAGKRLAYVYKAMTKSNDTHYRCLWGKTTRPHGNSDVVRAQFKSNLPAESKGRKVRVFMYARSGIVFVSSSPSAPRAAPSP